IVAHTWPYLLLRMVVFGVFAVVFAIMAGSGFILGHELGPKFGDGMTPLSGATFGTGGGIALGIAVIRILREYTLYLVKAGHIAVMGEMLSGQKVPAGFSQVASGARTVKENFVETSVLFVLDQLIKGVLKTIENAFKRIGSVIPGAAVVLSLVQSVITIAITYIDEMILAHIMRTKPADVWRAGADALVIYAQNAKLMFKNAFWLAVFLIICEVAVFAAIYFLMPIPDFFQLPIEGIDGVRAIAGVTGVVLIAAILVEPFAVCAMLQVFNKVSDSQKPDPKVERELADRSEAFRELRSGGPTAPGNLFAPAE
ncbi:MAG: hypothetical protein AAGG69_05870, partial [Pseudomonadota bacterium]